MMKMKLFLNASWLQSGNKNCCKLLFGNRILLELLSGKVSVLPLKHLVLDSVRNRIQHWMNHMFKQHWKPCSGLSLFQAGKQTNKSPKQLSILSFVNSQLQEHKVKMKQVRCIIYICAFEKHSAQKRQKNCRDTSYDCTIPFHCRFQTFFPSKLQGCKMKIFVTSQEDLFHIQKFLNNPKSELCLEAFQLFSRGCSTA